jgi:hypothetical protein
MAIFPGRAAGSILARIKVEQLAIESRFKAAVAYTSPYNYFFRRFCCANFFGSTVCLFDFSHSVVDDSGFKQIISSLALPNRQNRERPG